MNKFYKINLKLDDGHKEVFINKEKITRFYTKENFDKGEFKLVMFVDCGYTHNEDAEMRYESLYATREDLINQVNKICL